ncbi:MAG: response regulator [Acidimicrobiales bacterium]
MSDEHPTPDRGHLICIVEDHRFLGQLVGMELDRFGFSTQLVEPDALISATIRTLNPTLVLLDVELGPSIDSLTVCQHLVSTGTGVVLFTGVHDPIRLAEFLEAGAKGIISKTDDLERVAELVRQAVTGGSVDPPLAERISMMQALDQHRTARAEALEPFHRLSQSEAEVLVEIVDGATVAEIAARRFVSVTTIRAQVRAIHSKLGVSTQLGAVSLATRVGWPPDPSQRP